MLADALEGVARLREDRDALEAAVVLERREELLGPDRAGPGHRSPGTVATPERSVFGRDEGLERHSLLQPGRGVDGVPAAQVVDRDVQGRRDVTERVPRQHAVEDPLAVGVDEDVRGHDHGLLRTGACRSGEGRGRARRLGAGHEQDVRPAPRRASPAAMALMSTSFCGVVPCADAIWSRVSPKRTT